MEWKILKKVWQKIKASSKISKKPILSFIILTDDKIPFKIFVKKLIDLFAFMSTYDCKSNIKIGLIIIDVSTSDTIRSKTRELLMKLRCNTFLSQKVFTTYEYHTSVTSGVERTQELQNTENYIQIVLDN